MPPPSPTRDKRKVKQLPETAAATSPARSEMHEQQRRRSSQSPAMSPERKQSTTATYTHLYLRRRFSQQNQEDAESPRANGSSKFSSEDADEWPNGLKPQQSPANGHVEKTQCSNFSADMTVEKQPRENDVAGKGLASRRGKSGSINQLENQVMAKKRKAPCGRSTVVLAVAAGVVTVSVAGGVAVCRLYPSSPAAASIRIVAERAEEALFALLIELRNVVSPYAKELEKSLQAKWLTLMRNGHLTNAARAAHALANQKFRVFPGLANTSALVTVCMELMEDTRGQLRLAGSGLTDVLKLVVDWIQSHLKTAFALMELDLDAGVSSFLLTALAFLAEALRQGATWTVDEVGEWMGLESDVSDAELPSDNFLAPMMAHQAAITNIGRGLTARESRALDHVKHSEKRRVAITSATNSIIADTRTIALDSISDVKMAAIELMEERMKRVADQYAALIEQELKEYKHTSRQVQEEGGPGVLTEVVSNHQSHVDAAESLKQELAVRAKTTGEIPPEVPLPKDPSTTTGSQHEGANGEQAQSVAEPSHEERLPVETIEAPLSEEQGPSQDELPDNIDKEAHSTIVLAEEQMVKAELAEIAAEHNSFEEILSSEYEQIVVTASTEMEEPIDERSEAPVVGIPTSSVRGDHVREDQTHIAAELVEEKQQNLELASSDKEEVVRGEEKQKAVTEVFVELNGIAAELVEEKQQNLGLASSDKEEVVRGEEKQTTVMEVFVELDSMVLEMEHTQVEVTNLYEAGNRSEVDLQEQEVLFQQEEQTVAHLTVPVDGAEMEIGVGVDTLAADIVEKIGMEQLRPDVRTRIAILPGSEGLEEEHTETHKKKKLDSVQDTEHLRMDEQEVLAGDGAVEVYKELQDSEAVTKVEATIKEVKAVVADLELIEAKLTSLHSCDEAAAESDTQAGNTGTLRQEWGELEAKEDVGSVAPNEIEAQEMERVVVDKEIDELAQLEQVLVQEDERVRAENELRAIAQKEEIELQTEVHSIADQAPSSKIYLEDHATETIYAKTSEEVDVDRGSGGLRLGILLLEPALMQVGLLSVAFLALAMLAAYLLVRYRKRLRATVPRRRKRWQRLADMDDSDAEEVVLLPDDSSDDEAVENAASEESKLKTDELMSSVNAETTVIRCSGGEEADVEETTEVHEDVDYETEDFDEEEDDSQSDSVSVDHPATPKLNASDDSDTATASVGTPPGASTQETPDTSERALRRLRREMRS